MLELLPGKEFKITLKSGEIIEGKFSVWAYKRFCMKLGLSDKKLVARLSEDESSWADNIEMILCAVEHKQREKGEAFKFTDFHTCQWVEEMGGIGSESYVKLIGHSGSDLEPVEQKKTELS